jgi:Domain of unknown function (DUF309)
MMTADVFPPSYLLFAFRFNGGEFWESHEVLEGPWRARRSGFYHGLILLASAYVHVQRGNPRGVAAQLEKCVRALTLYAPVYLGLDVAALLAHAERARAAVLADPAPERLATHLPPVRIDPSVALLRGDEPEMGED